MDDIEDLVSDLQTAADYAHDAARAAEDAIDRLERSGKLKEAAKVLTCSVAGCQREDEGEMPLEYPSPATGVPVVITVRLCLAHLADRPLPGRYTLSATSMRMAS